MSFKTDKVAPQSGLLGEWRYQTFTRGGKVAVTLVSIMCLITLPIFGLGLILGVFWWGFFYLMIGTRKYRCVRVYPDRIEAVSVFISVQDRRIEASKIEAVSSALALFGKEKYGNVLVTGSGGSRILFTTIQDPIGLVNAIRAISSAPASKITISSTDTYQSETKTCPYCAEEVKREAVKCKHCGSEIS
jgi:hypothetical protein